MISPRGILTDENQSIRQGGDSFATWLSDTFRSWLSQDRLLAYGFIVIPQLGENAGEALRRYYLVANDESFCGGTGSNDHSVHDMITKVRDLIGENLTYDPSKPLFDHTECVREQYDSLSASIIRVPIYFDFDRQIGYLLAIYHSTKVPSRFVDEAKRVCKYVAAAIFRVRTLTCLEDFSRSSPIASDNISTNELIRQAKNVLGCKALILWTCHEHNDGSLLEKTYSDPPLAKLDMFVGKGIAGYCAKLEVVVRIDDLQDSSEVAKKAEDAELGHKNLVAANDWHSAIFMPIVYGMTLFGVVGAYSKRVGGFSDIDEQVLAPYVYHIGRVLGKREVRALLAARSETEKVLPVLSHTVNMLSRVHDARNELALASAELSMLNIDKATQANLAYYRERKETAEKALNIARDLLGKKLEGVRSIPSHSLNVKKMEIVRFFKQIIEEYEQSFRDAHKIKIYKKGFGQTLHAQYDERITREVVTNVLINARDWASSLGKGERRINVEVQERGDFVLLRIEDNGPGVDANLRDKVFEMFYTKKKSGFGIGLTVARVYMTLQGGSIACERSQSFETGATFILAFSIQ